MALFERRGGELPRGRSPLRVFPPEDRGAPPDGGETRCARCDRLRRDRPCESKVPPWRRETPPSIDEGEVELDAAFQSEYRNARVPTPSGRIPRGWLQGQAV